MNPVWSPDSRWLAYAKQLRNHLHAIFIYSVDTAESHQVTDGMSDAVYPVFDKTGKYLYFAASTDIGLTTAWLDMSSIDHPLSRSVYLIVLAKDVASPLAPESDEEKKDNEKEKKEKEKDTPLTTDEESADKPKDAKAKDSKQKGKESKEKEPVEVRIDFEGINQRILALPLPAKNYRNLAVGKTNTL